MKLKILLRPALSIVLGFIGAYLARFVLPQDVFVTVGGLFLVVAFLAFAIFGFILPELAEFAGKAGIAVLAKQIVGHLAKASVPDISVPSLPFGRRRERSSLNKVNGLIVDTSVLIDGRILDIAQTGFVLGVLLVIPSVVDELQKLADSGDDIKRARGRRGLEVLEKLEKERMAKVVVLNSEPKGIGVDDRLITLAKQIKGKILTVDFNLNKAASVRGIKILNINELANAVKTAVLPGESLSIEIKAKGKEKGQGVGYLADGTMVVVEDGLGLVGENAQVVVSKVIQTAAGKMIFARIAN